MSDVHMKTVKKSVAAKKPGRKTSAPTTRRGASEVAKLHKAVIRGFKARKSAISLASELGISRAYVYALKYRG